MKTAVISYSLTGNNKALAASIAQKLGAQHIEVTEPKKRTMMTIVFDLMFNKCPKTVPSSDVVSDYDNIVLVGPVWMSCFASPLRCYIKQVKKLDKDYSYVSISGGADHDNPKLINDIVKWAGKNPRKLIDLHISDLLPKEVTPTREMTSEYKINEAEVAALSEQAAKELVQAV